MNPGPPPTPEPDSGETGPFATGDVRGLQRVELGDKGLFAPGDVTQHKFRGLFGLLITAAVLVCLMGTVGLAAALALGNRDSEYIDATLKSLAPFILPTLGAVVGYAFGEQSRSNGA